MLRDTKREGCCYGPLAPGQMLAQWRLSAFGWGGGGDHERLDTATQQILDQMRESERKDSAMEALRAEIARLRAERERLPTAS